MDWLHLTTTELLECNTILTTDRGFEYLAKVGKCLNLNKVKKIILLNRNGKLEKNQGNTSRLIILE